MTEETNTNPAPEVVASDKGLVHAEQTQSQEQAEAPPPDHLPPESEPAADMCSDDSPEEAALEEGDEDEPEEDEPEVEEGAPSEEEAKYTELELLNLKIEEAKNELKQIEAEITAAEESKSAIKSDIDNAIADADLRLQEKQKQIDALQADFDQKVDAQSSIDKAEDEAENARDDA